jgi:hypothetical protein
MESIDQFFPGFQDEPKEIDLNNLTPLGHMELMKNVLKIKRTMETLKNEICDCELAISNIELSLNRTKVFLAYSRNMSIHPWFNFRKSAKN